MRPNQLLPSKHAKVQWHRASRKQILIEMVFLVHVVVVAPTSFRLRQHYKIGIPYLMQQMALSANHTMST